ncbi:hypothetical protein HWV62_28356 [Athelia sp. TMB]|nr:hypothetical protein HWV62_28356 [Athelia sp. TMB]
MVTEGILNRRASNYENVNPSIRLNGKRPASMLTSSIQSASKRRRVRATAVAPGNPRYAAAQAKRRSMTKKSASAVSVKISLRAGAPKDVEMKDAEAVSVSCSRSGPAVTPITLPKYLARPDYKEISLANIVALDPELKGVPLQYIQEGLETTGPAMMQVLASVEATPVKNALPMELSIMINDLTCDLPTHMLAVYSRQSSHSPNPTRRVTLFPTHAIVMSLHCANLPALPVSRPREPDSEGEMTVPVVPLCIPSPETFSPLSAYLYTKDAQHLLRALLPSGPATPPDILSLDADPDSPEFAQFSGKLRATYTAPALLTHAMAINGLWRNVVALGIFDERLWEALDIAWAAVLDALEGGKQPAHSPAADGVKL